MELDQICFRCEGRRAHKTFDGVPTCGVCEAGLLAEREAMRYCPVDGSPMVKEVAFNVAVDRCPMCTGVWLDGGELDLVKRAMRAAVEGDGFAASFVRVIAVG